MLHVKRMAVTALAALMIAGAVPALASADDATVSDQQETVVETVKKPKKQLIRTLSIRL